MSLRRGPKRPPEEMLGWRFLRGTWSLKARSLLLAPSGRLLSRFLEEDGYVVSRDHRQRRGQVHYEFESEAHFGRGRRF